MPFGSRSNLFSRRRGNFLNNVDRNLSRAEEDANRKYCPRCNRELYYLDEKIWVCGGCGWGLPDKFTKKYREEEEQRRVKDRVGDKSKGVITTESNTTKEQDIFVVPKTEERGYKKRIKDEYDYLRGDDRVYLEKPGYSMVSEQIIIPTDGRAQTVSSDELREQKELEQRRRRKGKHVF